MPLVCIAVIFLIFSILETNARLNAHAGLSITRLVGYHWLGGEAIFGIPISVSVVLFFICIIWFYFRCCRWRKIFFKFSICTCWKNERRPAKAAILASGLTGMISGSSVANTVTTGTFTIPIMKKTGLPPVKAGAVEVAASVNGQLCRQLWVPQHS